MSLEAKTQRDADTIARAERIHQAACRVDPSYADSDSGISDLICDLMHLQEMWFKQGLVDTSGATAGDSAAHHFECERTGDDMTEALPFQYPRATVSVP